MAEYKPYALTFGGHTHDVQPKRIDLVYVERELQTSIAKVESFTFEFAFAWAAARRQKVDGIPETFEAFLALEPDVEIPDTEDEAVEEGGKVSDPAPPTG